MLEFGRRGLAVGVVCLVGLLTMVPAGSAYTIDLEWRPLDQTVNVLDAVEIGLFGIYVPDAGGPDVGEMSSAQAILTWDVGYLQLTGSYDGLWTSGFLPGNSFGFNEASPPADGNGMWTGLVTPGNTMDVTEEGTLLTTITFQALAQTPETLVTILPSLQLEGHAVGYTKVMSGTYNVVGEIGAAAAVEIVPEPASLSLLALGALALLRRR